jgi:hypothetical protein
VGVKISGADEVMAGLQRMLSVINDPEAGSSILAAKMALYAHVITGYMKSTIYYKGNEAGATASYSGYEAARGGSHDFPQLAIDSFDEELYLDRIVGVF